MRGSENSKKFQKPGLRLLIALPVFVFLAFASSAHADDAAYSLCKLDKEVRTLRIQKEEGKCLAIYNKYGKDQNVGEAQNHSSCEDILGRVKTTLEGAGWKCRAVQSSGVSDLTSGVQ
ncbi:MAG: hypothetical protein KF789_01835 [Bdellovibrionaceae bacterium]|nr:hypothetical protein [Pseudobdellovibrionaceae bacterium]